MSVLPLHACLAALEKLLYLGWCVVGPTGSVPFRDEKAVLFPSVQRIHAGVKQPRGLLTAVSLARRFQDFFCFRLPHPVHIMQRPRSV